MGVDTSISIGIKAFNEFCLMLKDFIKKLKDLIKGE